LKDIIINLPTKVIFGRNKLQELSEYIKELGSKPFLVIDIFLEKTGLGDEIASLLKKDNIEVIKYNDFEPNPSCFKVDEAVLIAKQEKCNIVIGIGGGSAIDFAKAVAVLIRHPGKCWNYVKRNDQKEMQITESTLPIVAIPTTSGTGAEVTPYSVINNPNLKEKSTIFNEHILPKVSIVDPELMLSIPARLTALTGIDAFSHALESFINIQANSFSKIIAKEAIRIIANYLPMAVSNGKNIKAREEMAWASTLAGIAIAHVGPVLPHAMGQPVSGYLGAPHGGTIAACLIKILEFSYMSNLEVFADITEIIEPKYEHLPLHEKAERCVEVVKRLFNDIDCKVKFNDFGLREDDIEKVTNIALNAYFMDINNHPKQVKKEDIVRIYRECI
jgi:alcohol dehydrogenase class IV